MKVADSSFLVALFIPFDLNHERAVKLFKREDRFLVPEDILKETLTVIAYKLGFDEMKSIFESISSCDTFEIVQERFSKLISFYLSLSKKISFFDACVIYFSLSENLEPATFDKQLLSVWRKIRG